MQMIAGATLLSWTPHGSPPAMTPAGPPSCHPTFHHWTPRGTLEAVLTPGLGARTLSIRVSCSPLYPQPLQQRQGQIHICGLLRKLKKLIRGRASAVLGTWCAPVECEIGRWKPLVPSLHSLLPFLFLPRSQIHVVVGTALRLAFFAVYLMLRAAEIHEVLGHSSLRCGGGLFAEAPWPMGTRFQLPWCLLGRGHTLRAEAMGVNEEGSWWATAQWGGFYKVPSSLQQQDVQIVWRSAGPGVRARDPSPAARWQVLALPEPCFLHLHNGRCWRHMFKPLWEPFKHTSPQRAFPDAPGQCLEIKAPLCSQSQEPQAR
ncbi:uncharacterized protein LOC121040819 [Herpailurus yagouaroundi]|uniref:uncharacterized protein LOC121040819 n=1 Tax=Herpailurus yagouaroundi TaxID=1608482 RepID=UPI001AD70E58|nr:uncharacterized protein LOC121040819 [Puma yagouaroundi]